MKRLIASFSLCAYLWSPIVSAGWLSSFFDNNGGSWASLGTREDASWALDNSQACCVRFNQLSYTPVQFGYKGQLFIRSDGPIVQFKTGRSFVIPLMLPVGQGPYSIDLSSIIRDYVFAPAVITFDESFNPVRTFPGSTFNYQHASMFNENSLVGRISFNGNDKERYLLVFTTDSLRAGGTQILSEERLRAMAQSLTLPTLPDPIIPHAAVGVIDISVIGGNADSASDTVLFGKDDAVDRFFKDLFDDPSTAGKSAVMSPAQASEMAAKVPDQSPTPGLTSAEHDQLLIDIDTTPLATKVVPSSGRGISMMPETEALYNQLIVNAVTAKEIDKAMRLVEEAERAGSATARNTFIEAVKQLN